MLGMENLANYLFFLGTLLYSARVFHIIDYVQFTLKKLLFNHKNDYKKVTVPAIMFKNFSIFSFWIF